MRASSSWRARGVSAWPVTTCVEERTEKDELKGGENDQNRVHRNYFRIIRPTEVEDDFSCDDFVICRLCMKYVYRYTYNMYNRCSTLHIYRKFEDDRICVIGYSDL